MTDALIAFRGIRKSFWRGRQEVPALAHVDLEVRKGEFLAVVGPSGCGKSTLLNMTAGLMRPSAGEVHYRGAPVRALNLRVGYVTQADSLLPWSTVEENIAVPLRIQGVDATERRRRVAEQVALVGLSGFERAYPAQLSGGMRKRAALARTLVYGPETLLMDEPFSALDAQLQLVMQEQLLQIVKTTGATVVFVTHDLEEAIALADRVAVLSARPSRLLTVYDVPFARERDVYTIRHTPEFDAIYKDLWNLLAPAVRQEQAS